VNGFPVATRRHTGGPRVVNETRAEEVARISPWCGNERSRAPRHELETPEIREAPSLQEFKEHIDRLTPEEAESPRVQWLVAECRRAREEAHSLRNQMLAFRGGKSL
jgi:hypothetical protein